MALFRLGPSRDSLDDSCAATAFFSGRRRWTISRNGPRCARHSRAFLTPWEPVWPADDLTRGAFRRRLRRHADEMARDEAFPFLIFRDPRPGARRRADHRPDSARRRPVRHGRLLDGRRSCGAGLYVARRARVARPTPSRPCACTASRPPACRPTIPRSGCSKARASGAKGWRAPICASTAAGRIMSCSRCSKTIRRCRRASPGISTASRKR